MTKYSTWKINRPRTVNLDSPMNKRTWTQEYTSPCENRNGHTVEKTTFHLCLMFAQWHYPTFEDSLLNGYTDGRKAQDMIRWYGTS